MPRQILPVQIDVIWANRTVCRRAKDVTVHRDRIRIELAEAMRRLAIHAVLIICSAKIWVARTTAEEQNREVQEPEIPVRAKECARIINLQARMGADAQSSPMHIHTDRDHLPAEARLLPHVR